VIFPSFSRHSSAVAAIGNLWKLFKIFACICAISLRKKNKKPNFVFDGLLAWFEKSFPMEG
jgi:hypothetical protein